MKGQKSILDELAVVPPTIGATARAAERAERYVSDGRIARLEIGTRRIAAYVSDGREKRVKARIELSLGEMVTACSCRSGARSARACAHAAP